MAQLIEFPARVELDAAPDPMGCFDLWEIAVLVADHLERYVRAPWRQLNEDARMGHLRQAKALLQRIEDLETGKIPISEWGD